MIGAVKTSMRDRLVAAASELFYAQGIRAVSVDKVIERAETTKVTFYRHFRGKEDLVVAYLEAFAAMEREGVESAVAAADGDVDDALRRISELIGAGACSPGFRGCPFINAAAENPDPDSPVRRAVAAQRAWNVELFASLVEPLGLVDTAGVADALMLLRDGAMVWGYLSEPDAVAASFLRGARGVVSTA